MFRNLFFFISIYPLFCFPIVGFVTDVETGEPLENVNIYLSGSSNGTTTDINGNFQLSDLEDSQNQITISLIGYEIETKNISNKKMVKPLHIYLKKNPIQWKAINVMGMIPSKHSPDNTEIISTSKKTNTDQETLGTLLNNLHGIEVQSAHEYGRNVNVSIRGSSDYKPGGYNNRVLLLLDGFPVSIPNSGSSDWNAIPFETVQHIEIVRGPASSIYGHNSMGGVINIVTRTGKELSKWAPEIRLGSYDSKSFSLTHESKYSNMSIIGSVGYANSNGHRFNSGYEQLRFSLKINSSLSNNQKIQLSYIGCDSYNGQPGFIYPDNPGLISYRESFRLSNYLQFYYKKVINKYLYSLSLATNHFKTDYKDRDDTPIEDIQGITNYRDRSYIIRSQLQRFFNSGNNFLIGVESSLDYSSSNVLRNIYEQPEQNTIAGFMQYRKTITNQLTMDMGIRFDSRNVTGGEGYNVKKFEAISPKIHLSYKIDSSFTTYASYNRGFRAPSISELFLEYESSYGLLFRGNPTLKAESLTSIETGIKYKKKNMELFSNLFFNNYLDMIDFIYTIPVTSINREIVRGLGVELGSNVTFNGGATNLNLTYSYLDLENIKSNIPLLYRPKHKVRLTVVQQLPIFKIRLSTKYSSTQFYEDFLTDDHPINDGMVIFPLEQLPETFITDLSISRIITNYEISFRVKNLFDSNYVLIQHYPMPRRNFELSITKPLL